METGERILAFLYGTLKQGQGNHEAFVKAKDGVAEFVCRATTVEPWPLVLECTYNIPLVLYKPGTGHVSTRARVSECLSDYKRHTIVFTLCCVAGAR